MIESCYNVSIVCTYIQTLKAETEKENESVKSLCRLQKEQLSDLYYRKNRPQLCEVRVHSHSLPDSTPFVVILIIMYKRVHAQLPYVSTVLLYPYCYSIDALNNNRGSNQL